MIRLLADENFNANIVRGVLRHLPDLDIVSVQHAGLSGVDDRAVLEWAAREERIILTHDVNTMPYFAFERVLTGLPMPGDFVVGHAVPIRQAIEDLLLVAEYGLAGEWQDQVRFFPL